MQIYRQSLLSVLLLSSTLTSAQSDTSSAQTSAIASLISQASEQYSILATNTNPAVSSFAASGISALSSLEDIIATANPSQISVWESAAEVFATNTNAYSSLISEVNSAYESGSPTTGESITLSGTRTTGSGTTPAVASSTATAMTPAIPSTTSLILSDASSVVSSVNSAISSALESASATVSDNGAGSNFVGQVSVVGGMGGAAMMAMAVAIGAGALIL